MRYPWVSILAWGIAAGLGSALLVRSGMLEAQETCEPRPPEGHEAGDPGVAQKPEVDRANAAVGGVYSVELFYTAKPVIDRTALLARLKKSHPDFDWLGPAKEGDPLVVTDRALATRVERPVQWAILAADKRPDVEAYRKTIQQSWHWPTCEKTLEQCTATLLLTDLIASAVPYKERVDLFQRVLASLLQESPCAALYWQPSQQFLEPKEFLRAYSDPERAISLYGPINVRFFNISNQGPGDMLMDTMGLAVLGLPDLQCHFRGLEPREVARVLTNTAYYLFDQGDVIQSGHTVAGIRPEDKWKCRLEDALLAPARVVIDINPGAEYAAGTYK